jgi:aminoglycoside 6'-N-acetyltransferase I
MDAHLSVRPVESQDAKAWLDMRCALWPDGSRQEHDSEIAEFLAGNAARLDAVFIAAAGDGQAVGFTEVAIRPYAEGCYSGQVAYLEGWYVLPEARRQGVGLALVKAAENWARHKGCTEMASDAELANTTSLTAHLSAGFTEVAQLRCFRKPL